MKINMKAYISIVKTRFILLLQYRTAALAGICTQFLFGFVRVMVFEAFYSSTISPQAFTYSQTVSYIWMSQAMIGMLPWSGDRELQEMIRSGNVAYELCRPLNIYDQWYSRALALRAAPTLLRAVPLFIITGFFLPDIYRLSLPASPVLFLSWLMLTFTALLLSASITNLINVSTIWTISGQGVDRLLPALVMFFSGMIVPLPLFPQWMQRVIMFLPFAGLVDTPMRFYTGDLGLESLVPMLFLQVIWTVIFFAFGRFLANKGLEKVVIQGG
ncbi:ABC transporter permease [Natronospora cellulosivora (SeqCode)]